MKQKTRQVLLLIASLVMVLLLSPAASMAWSLNPFASSGNEDTASKKASNPTAKQPLSAWDKLTLGTKQFFDKTGETLGIKKPQPKKRVASAIAVPKTPQLQPRRKAETKSWFSSMFEPEEPERPKTVGEWMGSSKQLNP